MNNCVCLAKILQEVDSICQFIIVASYLWTSFFNWKHQKFEQMYFWFMCFYVVLMSEKILNILSNFSITNALSIPGSKIYLVINSNWCLHWEIYFDKVNDVKLYLKLIFMIRSLWTVTIFYLIVFIQYRTKLFVTNR